MSIQTKKRNIWRLFFKITIGTAILSVMRLSTFWILLPWLIYDGRPRLIPLLGRFDMLKEKWIDNITDLDTDSCKWLNKVITSYWLNSLRKFIYTYLKRVLDTKTAAYPKLKLMELEIGKEAPKIKNIVCHNSSKAFTIDLELDIVLPMNIQLALFFAKFGLRSISLKGVLIIQFQKIYACENDSRLHRQIQLTFKSCIIDYRFDGMAEFLNCLNPLIGFIFDQMFVYPNAITIPL